MPKHSIRHTNVTESILFAKTGCRSIKVRLLRSPLAMTQKLISLISYFIAVANFY